jgi:hypothetical protein
MAALAKNSKPAWEATVRWERHSFERARPNKGQSAKPDVTESEGDEGMRDEGGGDQQPERVTIRMCFISTTNVEGALQRKRG